MNTQPEPPQGMSLAEAGRILAVAISLDPRMPQPDQQGFIRGVWHDTIKHLPFDDAYQAVIAYYTSEEYRRDRNPIAPADIVFGVRRAKAVGSAPPYKALPAADPASDEVRASARAAYREVAGRLPEVAQIGRLPWSQQARRPRVTDGDTRARVVADLDARRQQAAELERRRAQGDFLRDEGAS